MGKLGCRQASSIPIIIQRRWTHPSADGCSRPVPPCRAPQGVLLSPLTGSHLQTSSMASKRDANLLSAQVLVSNRHRLHPLAPPSLDANTPATALSSPTKGNKGKVAQFKHPNPLQRFPISSHFTRGLRDCIVAKPVTGLPAYIKAAQEERKQSSTTCSQLTSGRVADSFQRGTMSGVLQTPGLPLKSVQPPHSFPTLTSGGVAISLQRDTMSGVVPLAGLILKSV